MVAAPVTEAAQEAVPRGFRQTEIGLIPEDWEVVAFSGMGRVITGPFGTLLSASEYVDQDGVPMISVGEIREGYISIHDSTPRIPVEVQRRLPQYILRAGDIVFGRKGSVDRSSLIGEKEAGWFLGSDGIALRPGGNVSVEYLAQQCQSKPIQAWLLQHCTGTTMLTLNHDVLNRLLIPLPPLAEQEAIAGALSDADGAIRAVERALAKQRAVKQAALHALLTPTTRLPGFSGDWETKTLGELGTFLKGSGVRKDEAQSGSIPCVRYGELYTDHHDVIRAFRSRISSGVASKATRLRYGDILFAGSGETKEEIGKSVAFAEKIEAFAGGDIVILRVYDAEPVFLGYAPNMPAIQRQKASKGQGDAVVHISSAALATISISLPPLPEQRAIAAVLSDMDAAIAAQEARRDKLKAVKQGMMQTLLTGKVRLV
jgi:type I restriction enzyme, S subunit